MPELAGAGPICVMAFLPTPWLVKPKKAEDEQDDDHKADEIDDAAHGGHLARHNPSADCAGSD
jgi:hypothetical protein